MPQIRLHRAPHGLRDLLRAYTVLLDGVKVGELRRGESLTFELTPGHHTVRFKIDFASSRTLAFTMAPVEQLEVVCSPRPLLMTLFDAIFRHQSYIKADWCVSP